MSPQDCIAALDRALSANGEDIILRRIAGTPPNAINVDVSCRAKVIPLSQRYGIEKLVGNIEMTGLSIVISPTQINEAQWPGGTPPQLPPFDVDPRLPRMNGDKVIVGAVLRRISYVVATLVGGTLVRIEIWAA